ncbi:GDP-mannose 6-dehydrogenase AlgD [Candidatus Vecturithrix granuli]|uniref:UDP-glucose 6-dehydrogenase n=1 Tax=Vecturithrix granuli TaxID=1499967 RepID=A0A081BXU0_VECG1|nr:GDP-mannose 6-dehydrogenase AlgD [Candidatus Vecturithrix granuli]
MVTAACLAHDGHDIIGVDVIQAKVESVNQGKSPLLEKGMDELVHAAVHSGRLRATMHGWEAVQNSDMGFICVGTPSLGNGNLNTSYAETVIAEIGDALRERLTPFLLILRSTVFPGTTRSRLLPILEQHAGRPAGERYDIVFHPEFLREGSSVEDFYHPPKILVGERTTGAGRQVFELYSAIEAPRFTASLETTEMVKYADNAFHAVKITFANEIGQLCKAFAIDSRVVMDIFCADTRLNISPKYLRPGFAFGGSCLPKDLRALIYASRMAGVSLPMCENILTSNAHQIEHVLQMIITGSQHQVGLVGLSFKPGTDDLRESPLVELAERLIGKGFTISIWDEYVRTAWLIGSNKAYIDKRIPHLTQCFVKTLSALNVCETVIVGHPVARERIVSWLEQGISVIDLVGSIESIENPNYQGIAW